MVIEGPEELAKYPRFPLKPSAIELTSVFLKYLRLELDKNPDSVNIMMQIYGDASEGVISTPTMRYDITPSLVGEYFRLIPDIFFVIKASTISFGRPHLDVDADYSHDDSSTIDPGEIEVNIHLPSSIEEIKMYIPELEQKIYPVLVHEMQHTIQKMIFNQKLTSLAGDSLESHMTDYLEIDARIEEIVSINDLCSTNESIFYIELCNYVQKYLDRNAKLPHDSLDYGLFYDQMISEHMSFYKRKILGND